MKACTSPNFCLLPCEYSRKRLLGSKPRRSTSAAQVGLVHAAAQVAQVLDDLRATQAGIEGKFAGQVADQLLDLGGLLPAIQPADRGAAAVRAQQTHQDAHGRGFACTIGSQETEDLALLNSEVTSMIPRLLP